MSTKHVRSAADLARFKCGLKIECGGCGNAHPRRHRGREDVRDQAIRSDLAADEVLALWCKGCAAYRSITAGAEVMAA